MGIKTYDTVSEAVKDLQLRGYTDNFIINEDKLLCKSKNIILNPDEFEIEEFYRFEGDSDPGDEMIVYAISSSTGVKGILINAYGTYSDSSKDKLISKLKVHRG